MTQEQGTERVGVPPGEQITASDDRANAHPLRDPAVHAMLKAASAVLLERYSLTEDELAKLPDGPLEAALEAALPAGLEQWGIIEALKFYADAEAHEFNEDGGERAYRALVALGFGEATP